MATFIVVFVGWLTNSGVMICVSWLSSAVEFKSLVNSEGDHDKESPPLSAARNEASQHSAEEPILMVSV